MRFSSKLIHIALVTIVAGAIVTFLTRESGQLHLRKGGEGESNIELPFGIRLERFKVECYENSKAPSDYVSSVVITPEDGSEIPMDISMNHIGRYRGWRIYQAGYDPDRRGSYFSVIHDPWGTSVVYAGYALLILGMLSYAFGKKSIWKHSCSQVDGRVRLWMSVAGAVFMLLMLFVFMRKYHQPLPVLRTWLLPVHIVSIMTAYLIFLACAVAALCAFFRKDLGGKLRHMSVTMLYPGCFLLVFGIIVGSLWSNVSWGGYWSWDPKETWALITLLVYVAPFHPRFFRFLGKADNYHVYMCIAILSVAMTYFGVNMFLGGMHSYR